LLKMVTVRQVIAFLLKCLISLLLGRLSSEMLLSRKRRGLVLLLVTMSHERHVNVLFVLVFMDTAGKRQFPCCDFLSPLKSMMQVLLSLGSQRYPCFLDVWMVRMLAIRLSLLMPRHFISSTIAMFGHILRSFEQWVAHISSFKFNSLI